MIMNGKPNYYPNTLNWY